MAQASQQRCKDKKTGGWASCQTALVCGKTVSAAVLTPGRVAQVYTLKVGSWQWREHTADVAPSPRSGHSAVALPDGRHLLVFGGGVPCTLLHALGPHPLRFASAATHHLLVLYIL